MFVNRYAAHYVLSPVGKLVKWPVVSVRDDGYIESLECFDDGFVERPSTRFFSGILCPAFVDVCSNIGDSGLYIDKSSLNRHFRDGTLLLGLHDTPNPEFTLPQWPQLFQIPSAGLASSGQNVFPGQGTLFERMKSQSKRTLSFVESLYFATARSAEISGISGFGRLEKGYFPGLLLLQNIDLVNLAWTPRSSVKWLNVPERSVS